MQTETNTPEPSASLEQQLAEAEERGYRRGLNEQIESKMNEPALWESRTEAAAPPEPDGQFRILDSARRSIWD